MAILGDVLQANDGGKIMIHLIWYIVVGLIAGVIAKSVMHVHMTIFWTIVLGIIGAILVLYVCIKLNIHFPRVL
jgi:uncharacterized membrane protein YeaQ/YmgE (transglycosylase-associated protein family)